MLRSPWVRAGFVVAALAAAVVAVWRSWPDVYEALTTMHPWLLVAALLVAPVYLYVTMLAWRVVLADLGSLLGGRDSFVVFFVSQLGKYLPGSLWNVVAAAELGSDRAVPRRRSLTSMAVAMLLALASGMTLGVLGVVLAPQEAQGRYQAALWLLPVMLVLVVPPVTNRLAALTLRLLRRPALEHPLTFRGTMGGLVLSLLGWMLAGTHVWLLGVATGMAATFSSYLVCTGAYALAWTLGFLFIPVPAGVGIREAVLVATLSGVLDPGAVLVVVLLSRVILTIADVGIAGVAAAMSRSGAAGDIGTRPDPDGDGSAPAVTP